MTLGFRRMSVSQAWAHTHTLSDRSCHGQACLLLCNHLLLKARERVLKQSRWPNRSWLVWARTSEYWLLTCANRRMDDLGDSSCSCRCAKHTDKVHWMSYNIYRFPQSNYKQRDKEYIIHSKLFRYNIRDNWLPPTPASDIKQSRALAVQQKVYILLGWCCSLLFMEVITDGWPLMNIT